jgi:hypothetical protein
MCDDCFSVSHETPRTIMLSHVPQQRSTVVCRAILKPMNQIKQLHKCDVNITAVWFCSCTLHAWIWSLDFVLYIVSCCGLKKCEARILNLMRNYKSQKRNDSTEILNSLVDRVRCQKAAIGVTWPITMGEGGQNLPWILGILQSSQAKTGGRLV